VTLLTLQFYDFRLSHEFFEYVGLIEVKYIYHSCVLGQHKTYNYYYNHKYILMLYKICVIYVDVYF
jgi:hypothetical protein